MNTLKISYHRPFNQASINYERRELKYFVWTLLGLAFVVYWILLPIWSNIDTHILGDSGTDAIRGMWISQFKYYDCSSSNSHILQYDQLP